MATVEFIGSNHVADIFDGDDVAADVPMSTIKPFGLFAVNKNGELTSGGNQSYHGPLKVWLKFCANTRRKRDNRRMGEYIISGCHGFLFFGDKYFNLFFIFISI